MSKYFAKEQLYELPSGNLFHPLRYIIRDGTLNWSHALRSKQNDSVFIPSVLAHEQHIIKTAHRLEELNTWLMLPNFELHECLVPDHWYNPEHEELAEGIGVYFRHNVFSNAYVLQKLTPHIKPHEELDIRGKSVYFKRC